VVAIDKNTNIYSGAANWQKVRRLKPDGKIETVAGTGSYGSSGDGGAASSATLQSTGGLTIDRSGRLFISDSAANRVRVVDTDGTISTYAGTGERAAGGEGTPAISSPLSGPSRLAADWQGNLVI
jgi:trimeric autotransporter adhesin